MADWKYILTDVSYLYNPFFVDGLGTDLVSDAFDTGVDNSTLNGRTLQHGPGTWAVSGSSPAYLLSIPDSGVDRSSTNNTFNYCIAGSQSYTGHNNWMFFSSAGVAEIGLIGRWISATQHVSATLKSDGFRVNVKTTAGGNEQIGFVPIANLRPDILSPLHYVSIFLRINTQGGITAWCDWTDIAVPPPWVPAFSGWHAACATGGELASGLGGFIDKDNGASSGTRLVGSYASGAPDYYTTPQFASIGELTQASNKQLSVELNKPGSATFSLPLDDPLAALINPVTTALQCYRNDTMVWSGPIWTIGEAAPEDRITISAVGWQKLLDYRMTYSRISFTNQKDWDVAAGLLNNANTRKTTVMHVGPRSGATNTISRTFEKFTNIGQAISDLSTIENGFDYWFDPVTLLMYIERTRGLDLQDTAFRYPDNVLQISRNIDSSTLANYVAATGKYGTGEAPPDAPYSVVQDEIGLFERQASLSDVTDASALLGYAGAEVLYNETPRVTYQFTPVPSTDENGAPAPFESYDLGDTVYLTANRGRIDIDDQPVRIFGFTINIDENGTERVTELKTTAQ